MHKLRNVAIVFCILAPAALAGCSGSGTSGIPDSGGGPGLPGSAAAGHRGVRAAASGVRAFTEPTCSTEGTGAFRGANTSNVAGGAYSVVTGGDSNYACGQGTAVLGGEVNGIASTAEDSSIAGGYDGVISGTGTYYASIGGGIGNLVDAEGGTVAGGSGNHSSYFAFVGGGDHNSAIGGQNAIAGGSNNTANGPLYGFVGAGYGNNLAGSSSAIVGGFQNTVSTDYSFLGGGENNTIGTQQFATLGGGFDNLLTGEYGVLGGGYKNTLSGASGTIAGGYGNAVVSTYGVVGGGYKNQAGDLAVVPGGDLNVATGKGSFAAGIGSTAGYTGDFVWSDGATDATALKATAINQFLARASGGVTFYSSANLAAGVQLAAGSGTWASLSDRNAKSNISPVSGAEILAKLMALPIDEWSYTTEQGVRHVGPMAQDFYAAFNVGEDNRHITTIDEDGVALAAVKALNTRLSSKLAQKDEQIRQLQEQVNALAAQMRALAKQR